MIGLAAILLLVVAVYGQTVAFPFHFDDYALLADPVLASPDGWWQVFRVDQTRPLTWLTFWLNHRLGNANPGAYHTLNVGFHLAAAAAAHAVFRRLASPPAALLATAVFALHPLQSEAVCYIFSRATILTTLFCLLSWREWLDDRPWSAVGLFCLALLAKEEAVSFPIFLWIAARDKPRRWPPLAAMLAASLAAGLRLLWVAAHTPGSGLTPTPSGLYLLQQPASLAKYLQLFLFPKGQNFDHHITLSYVAPVTLIALVALVAFRRPPGAFWLLGSLLLLAPTSSLIPLADLAYEHRMYLPLISISLAVALWLTRLPRPVQVLLPLALAATTFARARVWTSEQSLWADAAAKSPHKFRPKLQLARTLFRSDPERAESLLLEARQLEPRNPETYTQMGTLMLDQRNPYGARGEFEDALRLSTSPDTLSNRGTALFLLGRLGEAESDFQRALDLQPCHYNARHNLVLLYRHRGDQARLREVTQLPLACRFTPDQRAEFTSP
jgi:Tfp pilus assembly protein PilF